jgi:taurine transport system substrate-binding protein
MHKPYSFTRRDFGLLAGNLALVSLIGGRAGAAEAVAMLGHFSSANPQTYAKATGAFEKAFAGRAAVNYAAVSAAPQIIAAMAGGSMDLCNIGSSPMVTAFAAGLKVSMIYVQKYITDSECLAVRSDAGIRRLEDLQQKTVGLPFNTSAHFAMLGALKLANLKPTDVKLINMKPDAIVAAWKRKDIDATYIWYPVLGEAVQNGGTIIFKTGDLQQVGTLVFDGIIVRNEFKEKHPDLVLDYLREYDRVCRLYREKPQDVVNVLAPYLSLAPQIATDYVKTFYSLTPQEMASDKWMGLPGAKSTGVLKTLSDQAEFLKTAEQIAAVPDSFAPFVDSSFLAKMV